MKRGVLIVPAVLAALSLATAAWAGGSTCSSKSEGAAKQVAAGSHCTPGSSAEAKGQCTIGANNAVYSFAVPGVECESCVNTVQKAAMAQKGVTCAHVSLDSRTAYIVSDNKLNQRAIAKAITDAGYRCTFKSQGSKVRAEFMKAMAAGGGAASCSAKKEKERV